LELSLKAFFKSAFSGNFRVGDSSPVTSYNAVSAQLPDSRLLGK
jgi:hypothetical protein